MVTRTGSRKRIWTGEEKPNIEHEAVGEVSGSAHLRDAGARRSDAQKNGDPVHCAYSWRNCHRTGYGANETEAIGTLLHDTVEDCGGTERLRDIRQKFGDGVAGIVDGCTDTYETLKPPWLERKRAYIEHLKESDSSTRLVSASDKLHNTRAILAELRRHGLEVFERFSGKKDGTLWYYRTLVIAFRQHSDHADLIDELDRVVSEIEKFVQRILKLSCARCLCVRLPA